MVRLGSHRQSPKAVPWQANAAERRRLDDLLDDALRQTFPASDPIAIVQPAPKRSKAARRRARFPANPDGNDRAA